MTDHELRIGDHDGATRPMPTADPPDPPDSRSQEPSAPGVAYGEEGGEGGARRFWSARRVPAAIVAALGVAGTGLLLYDVAAVRAGHTAMEWRRRLAYELAHRPLDDGWMIGGAVAAMVLGLWLLVLALTPGLRKLLPMRPPSGPGGQDVRAAVDRSAVALLLRERAMKVPGVQTVRVHVDRRRGRARALSHFRDVDEVRQDLEATLEAGLRESGLARYPVVSVRVQRPAKR
jgi:hypothetical protein